MKSASGLNMNDTETHNLLDSIYIASPCNAAWDGMAGTDRVRNCGDCHRKVFNLSDMSKAEAQQFLEENGTSQCLTFYRRADGTIMTDDCPIGLRKVRDAARRIKQIAAVIFSALISNVSALAQTACSPGNIRVQETTTPINKILFRKQSYGMLQQLGVPDSGSVTHSVPTYKVPNFSELRSGQYALGKELVERQGRMFVVVEDVAPQIKLGAKLKKNRKGADKILGKDQSRKENLEPVPTILTFHHSDLTAKILEAQGHLKAAEAFHKIYLKCFGDSSAGQQQASDYRDFLFRQKRIDEARQVEKDFYLAPETIGENSDALKPVSKQVRIDMPYGK
jgi:hypothetical protein